MRANLLQHFDITQLAQPIMVVDHHGVGGAITKSQELLERGADRRDIGFDSLVGQHLADFVLAGWVADARSAAAHHDHRLVAGLLQAAQQHD